MLTLNKKKEQGLAIKSVASMLPHLFHTVKESKNNTPQIVSWEINTEKPCCFSLNYNFLEDNRTLCVDVEMLSLLNDVNANVVTKESYNVNYAVFSKMFSFFPFISVVFVCGKFIYRNTLTQKKHIHNPVITSNNNEHIFNSKNPLSEHPPTDGSQSSLTPISKSHNNDIENILSLDDKKKHIAIDLKETCEHIYMNAPDSGYYPLQEIESRNTSLPNQNLHNKNDTLLNKTKVTFEEKIVSDKKSDLQPHDENNSVINFEFDKILFSVMAFEICCQLFLSMLFENVHTITNSIKHAASQNSWHLANEKIHSLAVKVFLLLPQYFLSDNDKNLQAELLCFIGILKEKNESYQDAILNYQLSLEIANNSDLQLKITERLYNVLARDKKKNKEVMKLILENTLKNTKALKKIWLTIFNQVEKSEDLLFSKEVQASYETFNTILFTNNDSSPCSEPSIFMQQIFPFLSIRYFRLQALLILIGQQNEIDGVPDASRFPLAIECFKKSLTIATETNGKNNSMLHNSLRKTLAQLESYFPKEVVSIAYKATV